MRSALILVIFALSAAVAAQSGRSPVSEPAANAGATLSVKDLFDQANGYIRAKAAEYDAKKVPFSERLLEETRREQRQLAAKNASLAAARKDLSGEDLYYLGMLHWITENLEGAADPLARFARGENAAATKRQSARAIVAVIYAKQGNVDAAEKTLDDYLKSQPTKTTEKARVHTEIAKAYKTKNDFAKMAPHAEQGYAAAKALILDPASRQRGLDEILDSGMLVFEAYRGQGEQKKADAALDDMRNTAISVQSAQFYYFVVDQKIKYMIDTGRKVQALSYYAGEMASTSKDFSDKAVQAQALQKLKRRDKHYRLLGERAQDLPAVDQWFPGERKTMADLKGKVVLLDFWATWCRPCYEAFPHLIEWNELYARDGLEILGITRYYGTDGVMPRERPAEIEELKRFREKHKLPYDFVVADGQAIQLMYGGTDLPTAVLIDRKGVIRYAESGTSPMRLTDLREMILKLLAEK